MCARCSSSSSAYPEKTICIPVSSFTLSAFTCSKHRDVITVHFICHLCSLTWLIHNSHVFIFFGYIVRRVFGRRALVIFQQVNLVIAIQRDLFAYQACHTQHRLCCCNHLYELVEAQRASPGTLLASILLARSRRTLINLSQ